MHQPTTGGAGHDGAEPTPSPADAVSVRHHRLGSHRLVGDPLPTPEAVVDHLLAVQAQEYAFAKWGIALRTHPTTDAALDALLDAGALLRTHVLRPTWHLVRPADIRWLLALTAPRVHRLNAPYYRRSELDDAALARGDHLITDALRDGPLTRAELAAALAAGGIEAAGHRLAYLLMHAELEALICSGPRHPGGRQTPPHTYALLDDRVPSAAPKPRDEALAELARRFLASRAPATPADLAKWASLTLTDARAALASLGPALTTQTIDGTPYSLLTDQPPPFQPPTTRDPPPVVHLLPIYDEYVGSYADSTPILPADVKAALATAPRALDHHLILIDGLLAGGWRREAKGKAVTLLVNPLRPLTEPELTALRAQADRYAAFLDATVVVLPQTSRPSSYVQVRSADHGEPGMRSE